MSTTESNYDNTTPSPVYKYKIGERVLARWSDGKDYPGVVASYFPDGAYNVIFYDGYRKKVKQKYMEPLPEDYEEKEFPVALISPSKTSKASQQTVVDTPIPIQTENDRTPKMEVSLVPVLPKKEFHIEEDHNHFKCPAENCKKAFRKEKALSGHLKHYHPELAPPKRQSKPPSTKSEDSPKSVESKPSNKSQEKPRTGTTVEQNIKTPTKSSNKQNSSSNLSVKNKEDKEDKDHSSQIEEDLKTALGQMGEQSLNKSLPTTTNDQKDEPTLSNELTTCSFQKEVKTTIDEKSPIKSDNNNVEEKQVQVTLLTPTKTPEQSSTTESMVKLASPIQPSNDKTPKMEVSLVPVLPHPKKEFFIEEDHNHFKCPAENCTKAFRKEKTLSGHLKHYHPELARLPKRKSASPPSLPKPSTSKGENNSSKTNIQLPISKIYETPKASVVQTPTKTQTPLLSSSSTTTTVKTTPVKEPASKSSSKSKKVKKDDQHKSSSSVNKEGTVTSQKSSSKSSKSKGTSGKQSNQLSDDCRSATPLKSNLDSSLESNLNVYMPLELQVPCEVATSDPPMTLFSPSPNKKDQHQPPSHAKKKETTPRPTTTSTDINNQQPITTQPTTTGKKRGRKRKTELLEASGDFIRFNSDLNKSNKVRLVEKVSSVSPSLMMLDESNPIPNSVLPFSDPRTIREIHESDDVDELVNCICDLRKESGLMVQCECCLTWQHGSCLGIKSDKDLPEVYVCFICKNPRGCREKSRYNYDWTWLRNGSIPVLPGDSHNLHRINSSAALLSKKKIMTTNQLLSAALEIVNVIHDLKRKIAMVDSKNIDLNAWKDSWVAPKEPKIAPSQPVDIVQNDFAALKANENDMINDILGFSKNILETVPSDQDKNDVPDDLENEIAEGTDLIDFIASSYGELNGIKGEESITHAPELEQSQLLDGTSKLNPTNGPDGSFVKDEPMDCGENPGANCQANPSLTKQESKLDSSNMKPILSIGGDQLAPQVPTIESSFDPEKTFNSTIKMETEIGPQHVIEVKEVASSGTVEDDHRAICRQNLIEHILDIQNRLEKRLDLLEKKVAELEKEYGLDPSADKVEQDTFTFKNIIKDLYKDLEIVHKISLCTR